MTLPNWLIWAEQVCILAAAGALAALRIANPKVRLQMWQALLGALLLLPIIEPWKAPLAPPPVPAGIAATTSFAAAAAPEATHLLWRPEYWLWLIAAGAVLRLLWMFAGLLRLRRMRLQGRPLPEPPLRFASNVAEWFASDSVTSPVTYGWRRPVILLPTRTLQLPEDLREAIQCHELIHVHRGDWLWVLAESVIRSLLWFHPAVWLVMSRIQLAREQTVDLQAVSLLANRDSYLDALVAVASYRVQPGFAPAFLRKRQLLARVEAVAKENVMSRSRILAGAAAALSVFPIAIGASAWLFPFIAAPIALVRTAKAQTTPDSPGIKVDAGAVLSHRAGVTKPQNAAGGRVVIEATLAGDGSVADARVIGGPQELRNAALSSVLQWHYQPGPARTQISIDFGGSTAPPPPAVPLTANPVPAPSALPEGIYRPGNGVSNPVPISHPEPQYSEAARKARWGGTVLLSVVVDETGVPRNIKVVKPLGFGLDEKAIESVEQWRFRPGQKDGVAVPVAAQIEVTFRPLD